MIIPSGFSTDADLAAATTEQLVAAYVADGFSQAEAEAFTAALRGDDTEHVD